MPKSHGTSRKRNKIAIARRRVWQKKKLRIAGFSEHEIDQIIMKTKLPPRCSRNNKMIILNGTNKTHDNKIDNYSDKNVSSKARKTSIIVKKRSYLYCPQTNEIIQDACCRICLQEINNVQQVYDLAKFAHKLLKCSPEMDLSKTPDAKICAKCCKALDVAYDFKIMCQKAEEKFNSCIRVSPTPEFVTVDEDLQSNDIKQEECAEETVEVKQEVFEDEDGLSRWGQFETGDNWTPGNDGHDRVKDEIDVENETCLSLPEYTFDASIKEELVDVDEGLQQQ